MRLLKFTGEADLDVWIGEAVVVGRDETLRLIDFCGELELLELGDAQPLSWYAVDNLLRAESDRELQHGCDCINLLLVQRIRD